MPYFYLDSYTDSSISIVIHLSSEYNWYFIFVYKGNEQIDLQGYYRTTTEDEIFEIENLESGTEYTIEVQYGTSVDESAATSLGSLSVTTDGENSEDSEDGSGTIYYTIVKYDANGGTDAPSKQTFESNEEYSTVTLSDDEPTREGYNFIGWATTESATSARYYPGETYSGWDATEGGYTVTLYAVWVENNVDGLVYINGQWYIPYIFHNRKWTRAKAYIYTNEWTPAIMK